MRTSRLTLRNAIKGALATWVLWFYAAASVSQTIEEIVVTAQKREQLAQDVGISISAFTAAQLRSLNFSNSEDVARHVPGLQAASFAGDPTVMLFAIRGVGQNDFADHHEGPTAIYVDGAYVSALGAVGFHLFDLERVEVLRGPQGTLFGRNATGGLVHYISAKPGDEFEGFIDVTVGEYNQRRFEGAVSGPISDEVRARLSLASNEHDGWLKNRIGPDVHEANSVASRLQLDADLSPKLSALLKLHWAEDDDVQGGGFEQRASVPGTDGLGEFLPATVNADLFGFGSCAGCDPLGYRDDDRDVWAGEFDTPDDFNREAYGGTLQLSWVSEGITLTSITDVLDIEKSYGEDSDGSPNPLLRYATYQDTQQFSQELRVAGLSQKVAWTAGLYYLQIEGDYRNVLDVPLFFAEQTNTYSLDTSSWALFGQFEYDLSERWRMILGLRWTEDDKDYEFEPLCAGIGCEGFFVFPGLGAVGDIGKYDDADRDYDWAAKAALEWRVDSDLMLFAGVTRGNKASGFNAPLDGLLFPEEMPYDAEVLTSFELGFKSTLFDRALSLNGSAFYYHYKDKQAFTFSGLTQTLINRSSDIMGMELELSAAPADGLEVALGVSLLDATVDDIPLPSGRSANQEMAQAPELSINAMVQKQWRLGLGSLGIAVDASYVSEQFFNSINHRTSESDSYTLWNGRSTYRSANQRWSVALFVKNITEEEVVTYAIDASAFGYTVSTYAPPRWFGAEFRFSF
ncbi:MAG: TonB-dependent receptor [Pseudomonadales bacterium]